MEIADLGMSNEMFRAEAKSAGTKVGKVMGLNEERCLRIGMLRGRFISDEVELTVAVNEDDSFEWLSGLENGEASV